MWILREKTQLLLEFCVQHALKGTLPTDLNNTKAAFLGNIFIANQNHVCISNNQKAESNTVCEVVPVTSHFQTSNAREVFLFLVLTNFDCTRFGLVIDVIP